MLADRRLTLTAQYYAPSQKLIALKLSDYAAHQRRSPASNNEVRLDFCSIDASLRNCGRRRNFPMLVG